jgi:hypothetical protein
VELRRLRLGRALGREQLGEGLVADGVVDERELHEPQPLQRRDAESGRAGQL